MNHLYEPLGGERYLPSGLCRTGWNDTDQHGGPPSGLLVRAIEGVALPAPMRSVRVSVHLMRAIPIAPMVVTTAVLRAGKQVAVVDAHLTLDDGTPVATARAQCIRTEAVEVPVEPSNDRLPWPPEGHPIPVAPWDGSWGDDGLERFHLHAMTVRSIAGGWETPGPGAAWLRLDAALVAGEDPSPAVRFAALADATNGLTHILPVDRFSWVNPDLTVALHRPPTGEWLGLEGRSDVGPDGIGVATATAYDRDGRFGGVTLTQLVRALP